MLGTYPGSGQPQRAAPLPSAAAAMASPSAIRAIVRPWFLLSPLVILSGSALSARSVYSVARSAAWHNGGGGAGRRNYATGREETLPFNRGSAKGPVPGGGHKRVENRPGDRSALTRHS